MFNSPKESFLLPTYVEAMAHASLPIRPSCGPNVDSRIMEYLDIDATIDASFPIDCSNSKSKSMSGEFFQWRSLKSRPCSDNSMPQSF